MKYTKPVDERNLQALKDASQACVPATMTYLALHTFKCYAMEIILACPKCPTSYILYTDSIELDISGELIFNPEPICPKCGYNGEPIISAESMEKIDDLVFSGKIKSRK